MAFCSASRGVTLESDRSFESEGKFTGTARGEKKKKAAQAGY